MAHCELGDDGARLQSRLLNLLQLYLRVCERGSEQRTILLRLPELVRMRGSRLARLLVHFRRAFGQLVQLDAALIELLLSAQCLLLALTGGLGDLVLQFRGRIGTPARRCASSRSLGLNLAGIFPKLLDAWLVVLHRLGKELALVTNVCSVLPKRLLAHAETLDYLPLPNQALTHLGHCGHSSRRFVRSAGEGLAARRPLCGVLLPELAELRKSPLLLCLIQLITADLLFRLAEPMFQALPRDSFGHERPQRLGCSGLEASRDAFQLSTQVIKPLQRYGVRRPSRVPLPALTLLQ
mmetsp:Transcript_81247/g.226182  ORF Transcript_81247/g.226182 Transcript_81247/m.226182 type:complete len:295 (-) Transcript_81247:234-1118(-)